MFYVFLGQHHPPTHRSRAAVRFDAAVIVNPDPESGLTAADSLVFCSVCTREPRGSFEEVI